MPVTYRKVKALLRKNYFTKISIYPEKKLTYHRIHLGTDGSLIIQKGYAWDLASGPVVNNKKLIEATLVHDALSELMHNNLLPKSYWNKAADVMYSICIKRGMFSLRARWIRRVIIIAGPEVTKSRKWITV